MRKVVIPALGTLLLTVSFAGLAPTAETTITGHLRDSVCFLGMGAKGPGHHKCAMECAGKGAPVLLETADNKYYVLMPAKDKTSLPKSIMNKMEDQVTVTGNEYSQGGMNFLSVKSVK